MKVKVSEWGNSQGVRITGPMLEHLNVTPGEELNVKITGKGIELMMNAPLLDQAKALMEEAVTKILEESAPVTPVEDPYAESDIGYIVVAVNLGRPVIREVPKDTINAYTTLADAKEAARQIIQATIAEAKESLIQLRQLGIDNISYIVL